MTSLFPSFLLLGDIPSAISHSNQLQYFCVWSDNDVTIQKATPSQTEAFQRGYILYSTLLWAPSRGALYFAKQCVKGANGMDGEWDDEDNCPVDCRAPQAARHQQAAIIVVPFAPPQHPIGPLNCTQKVVRLHGPGNGGRIKVSGKGEWHANGRSDPDPDPDHHNTTNQPG
jgi:hypothetical protein